ncbi:hypothetical protein D3C80_2084490 [compost metagenome]
MLLVRSGLVVCTLFGATKSTVPELEPTGMVICWPLARVTTNAEPVTGAVTEAV